jgi:hypothetical protein
MSLDPIAARTRRTRPADAELPVVRLDADADAGGLVAWFGADTDRSGARLVIRGEDVGVIERTALYELVAGRTLGWGDSVGATLPGDPSWEPIELRCPVADCPQSPAWVLSYDPEAPPECAVHAGTTLMPAT